MRARTTRSRAAACTAVLLAGLVVDAAPAVADAPDDAGLEQTVEADEEVVAGDEVVVDGHVDVGPRFLDDEWTMLARDDREVPSVWRDPERTVLHLGDAAVLPAPDGPDYEFLGVEPGTSLHVVPQTQAPDVVWLGWNTQDPQVVDAIDRGASLRLDGLDGPGEVFVFLQEGVTGPPNVLWDSGEPLPQELWMEVNTHVHANWVFTEPGIYRLDVTMLAELQDGTSVEDASTLVFAVGEDTDPEEALAGAADDATPGGDGEASAETAASPAATPSEDTAAGATDAPEASAPSSDTGPGVLVWGAAAAGLVLLLLLVARAVRTRRARAAADHDAEDES
ncbi:choice-of-anchor M domain-containing protein [Myceligenerans pegani]|uniref:Choice-of-anchor M domain-containing protein n=1 Tax=Myceligenerans pegani TaxID=2776917 RepID=A0ABR9N504_9MICO|nr:choice-of-anchor M domain-containing protein [Myceligenerans sp. TRM 65318]MBE1878062.1 choice-of-anchor M domain-containing protein [Myceligenerans sp. TRM 65318]MBE3020333.1 choice-of-anchor M domain-containing protein [Myceligenerans sp. TRM 65318]